jgi:hypothetical protein
MVAATTPIAAQPDDESVLYTDVNEKNTLS